VSGFPWKLVTVDIDGTLTLVHGWREIAVAFGRLPEFETTNQQFGAHEIGEDQHLTNLLEIADGHTVDEVEAVLRRTPKLSGISNGVHELQERGAHVALLSHNPNYVAEWYQRTFGFDDFDAVPAQEVDHGRIGPCPAIHADKTEGFRALLARCGATASQGVHVGDGWSDAEVFRLAGGGIALNSRDPEVNRLADLALSTRDFRDVVRGISHLVPRS
jgi:phosphoserine phosphatase